MGLWGWSSPVLGGGVAGFLSVLVPVGWFLWGGGVSVGGVEGEGAVVVGEAEVE